MPCTDRSPWFVYLLRCRDGSLYTGITLDVGRRLKAHASGRASRYTRSRLPVRLVYSEVKPDRSSALRREAAIKQLPRSAKQQLVKTSVCDVSDG
ncbi:MAG: GIY-YIG nuclease family protein [Planctomycetaceae bacterium]